MLTSTKLKRIEWIDVAKGITILLVIVGHTVGKSGLGFGKIIRAAIFSFHMPLFFILSCVTYMFSCSAERFLNNLEKSFKHLVVPAVILFGIKIVYEIFDNLRCIEWRRFIAEKINTFIFANSVNTTVLGIELPGLGYSWFLISLFLGRTLFDFFQFRMKKRTFYCAIIICTFSGLIISRYQWLPLCFDTALAMFPMFYVGYKLQNWDFEKLTLRKAVISFVIWAFSLYIEVVFFNDYLNVAERKYSFWPLSYITAFTGFCCMAYFCKKIENHKLLKPIKIIGINSLYLLMIHVIDYTLAYYWQVSDNEFINCGMRLFVDIGLFSAIMYIKTYGFRMRKKRKLK